MNKRRSMNAAIDMTPESIAFIRGGIPSEPVTTQAESLVQVHDTPEPRRQGNGAGDTVETPGAKETREPIESENFVPEKEGNERRRSKGTGRGKGVASNREEPIVGMANFLVPLTTRLSLSTAAALKRAGLEQRLYGRQPATVQEIAEEAIRAWLGEQGYL
jgi:hypothetical protein